MSRKPTASQVNAALEFYEKLATPPDTIATAQVAHGLCRADDPNEEAAHEPDSSSASHKDVPPSAVCELREGLPVSVSDDRAGTSIPAAASYAQEEKHRHACEVRYVRDMTPARRAEFLKGVAEKRGEQSAERIRRDL